MKSLLMRLYRDRRLLHLTGLISLCLVLLFVSFLPSLSRIRKLRRELLNLQFETEALQHFSEETNLNPLQQNTEVPEMPPFADFITTLRKSESACGIHDLSFETGGIEEEMISVPEDEYGPEFKILRGTINVSFSSGLKQAACFLDAITNLPPYESFTGIRFTRSRKRNATVDVTLLVNLYGVPR